jgi:hypothetical protein
VTGPGPGFAYAEGIGIGPFTINGWTAWVLYDKAPNGHRRPVAFLDPEALYRIALQSTAALREHDPAMAQHTAKLVTGIAMTSTTTATDGTDERK